MKKIYALVFPIFIPTLCLAATNSPLQKLNGHSYLYNQGYYASLVVIGENGVLITDPANPTRAKALKQALKKVTDKSVTAIVLSQAHFDHIGGTREFPGAKTYIEGAADNVLRFDPLHIAPSKFDVSYHGKHVINLGNVNVDVIELGASDGDAASAIYVPNDQVVYTADLYQSYKITNKKYLPSLNGVGVKEALDRISTWKIKYAIDGHTGNTSVQALYDYRDLYDDIYHQVLAKVVAEQKKNPSGLYDYAYSGIQKDIHLTQYDASKWQQLDQLPAHVQRMALSIVHGG
ncbi:hypothetical protein SOPP22_12345 [Shewanella sp. OPT22]|nr:hypothetical protein SOPP22_12345 [Shewanella sp. OPT22]